MERLFFARMGKKRVWKHFVKDNGEMSDSVDFSEEGKFV